jgi:hypothetical protein
LDTTDILIARVAVSAMTPISIGASLWFWSLGVQKISKSGRYIAITIHALGLFGIPVLQVIAFRALANVEGGADDVFLFLIIITQATISLIAAIAFARSRSGKISI